MTTPATKPPASEIGYAGTTPPTTTTGSTWSAWISPEEEVAALQWPMSVKVYHRMRTDSQMDALLKGVTWPIRRRSWRINPNGASDQCTEQVATDLGLPIKGAEDEPLRGRKRFSHDDHLRHALLALVYGHMFMEQSGVIDDNLDWRLRKLAPRMPQSISKIDVARDGGLAGITQWGSADQKPIPVSQLVAYVWEREGGNWLGRSMLRPVYRHWLVKDRMIRIDALKNERYGLGIPTGTAPPGARDTAIYGELAQGIRAGERSGVGLPNGATLGVQGVTGALPDTLGTIAMHDEAMARAFLQTWQQLGSTKHGSRALGETFMDFHLMALETVQSWYTTITNEHVIEDIVDWNFGIDENAPLIEAAPLSEDDQENLAIADLIALIDDGVLVIDDDLEAYVRARYALPERGENPREPRDAAPAPAAPVAARRDRSVAAASQTASRVAVGHRAPSKVEAAAGVDFDTLQREWQNATGSLVGAWQDVRDQQIAALTDAVAAAAETGDPTEFASLDAPVLGADLIEEHMMGQVQVGIDTATAEATAQGATVSAKDAEALRAAIKARASATATLMARSLADSAARNALTRYGPDMAAEDVAAGVAGHLADLADTYLNDILGGALTQAQNTGRREVMGDDSSARIYASELMDGNTCATCEAADGTEYGSMSEAEGDYPAGGNAECEGGPRCRGTLVAVYDAESDPSE